MGQGTCVTGMAGLLAGGAAAAAGGLAGRASMGTCGQPSTHVSALALSRSTVAANAHVSMHAVLDGGACVPVPLGTHAHCALREDW